MVQQVLNYPIQFSPITLVKPMHLHVHTRIYMRSKEVKKEHVFEIANSFLIGEIANTWIP